MALSECLWTKCDIARIRSTTILHSGSPSNHICGVAIALSSCAWSSWETAGSIFYPISEQIIRIRLQIHLSFASAIVIYASTNCASANTEASVPPDKFYYVLQDTMSSVSPRDMVIILGDFNACVGSNLCGTGQ